MSISTAVSQLLEVEEMRGAGVLSPERTLAIALSRVGAQSEGEQRIVCGTLAELAAQDPSVFGNPLHSLVIIGKRLHELEVEYADAFAVDKDNWRSVAKTVYGCNLD